MNKHITNGFPGMACAYMDVEERRALEQTAKMLFG